MLLKYMYNALLQICDIKIKRIVTRYILEEIINEIQEVKVQSSLQFFLNIFSMTEDIEFKFSLVA